MSQAPTLPMTLGEPTGGPPAPGPDLIAREGLTPPRLLEQRQFTELYALEGREARAAAGALPPPPDGTAILGRPRILNLTVFVGAERAAHQLFLVTVRR